EYFEKSINDKGDEVKICKILDERTNMELLIGMIQLFQKKYDKQLSMLRNSKITNFARSYRPHPKHIQKRQEEVTFIGYYSQTNL
ncbi:2047_t:CDS:2, partial [Funneliformis geosporum]